MVPNRFLTEKAKGDWNQLAEYYKVFRMEKGTYNEIVEIPTMLELIGNVKGKTILDAGCGTGYYSILLSKKGANVTGIDISEKMIEIAKKNAEESSINVKFQVGDMQDLSMFKEDMFELVTSSIVIGYLDDLRKAFSEVYRVLKPQGIFTFSENHPILGARSEGWEMDSKGNKLHWNMDNYFNRAITIDRWGTKNGKVIETSSQHRIVQDYFDDLISTGFVVERIVEPEPTEEGKRINKTRYEKAKRIPYFIFFKARKARANS